MVSNCKLNQNDQCEAYSSFPHQLDTRKMRENQLLVPYKIGPMKSFDLRNQHVQNAEHLMPVCLAALLPDFPCLRICSLIDG